MYTQEHFNIATHMPAWVTVVLAITVFSGAIAATGLLPRKSWSVTLQYLLLVAVIV